MLALVVDALAVAAQAMVGGADEREARRVGNRLLMWGVMVGLALAALFALVGPWLPRLFTDDPQAIAIGHTYLASMLFAYPMMAFGMTSGRLLQGLGHGMPSLAITTGRSSCGSSQATNRSNCAGSPA